MGKVYLVINGSDVLSFYSEADMKAAGFQQATLIVTAEEFNSNGCYTRIINGQIVVGKTDEEKQIEDLRGQISDIDSQLSGLDGKYLTPRILSGIALQDAFALDCVNKHEAAAVPLREQRAILQSSLNELLGD